MRTGVMRGAVVVAGVLGLMGASIPAASATSLHTLCTFSGHANVVPPVLWVGGGGSFGFTTSGGGSTSCAGEHDGVTFSKAAQLDASGTYTSLVCGTTDPLNGPGSF